MTFPDDSIQASIAPSPWWIKHEENQLERGCLVAAFIPHVDQIPYTIIPKGRKQAEEHGTAEVEIKPLEIKKPRHYSSLPVAAMPIFDNEILTAYRAKKRPCLVLGTEAPHVEDTYRRGMPKRSKVFTKYGVALSVKLSANSINLLICIAMKKLNWLVQTSLSIWQRSGMVL